MAAVHSDRIFGVTAEETLSFSSKAPYCLRQRGSATMVGRLAEKNMSRFLKLFCSDPAGTPPGCKPILRRCPGVSLRSTAGYSLSTLRVGICLAVAVVALRQPRSQRGRNECGGLCNPRGKGCAAVRGATRRSATSSTTPNTYPGWVDTAGWRGFALRKSTCVAQLAGKLSPQRLPQIAQ